jgi:hypothetical protein
MVENARKCGGIDTASNASGIRMLSQRRIGAYPIDSIGPDGTLKAGCHTIDYAELRLLAERLGLTKEESTS